ncbi:hypothetical protein C8J56DRAFT_1015779 [Mycena floridula]|nr:hypothetical protein C8J56DRAFT_1015779 [Mycena floridula]
MAPHMTRNEAPAILKLERYSLAGDLLVGVGYGIQLVLFWSCARYLWERRKIRTNVFLLAYISVLLAIETVFVGVQSNTMQLMYIDNRDYPGGPWQYFLDTQNLPVNVAFYVTLFVLTFLSDLLMLWRCWVIWTASGRLKAYVITAFPTLCLVASFVLGTLWTLYSSRPASSLYSALPLIIGTSYYAVSLGINIMLTILIAIRLLLYRRRALEVLPPQHAKQYLSILAILVESSAIYSFFAILFLITYAVNNPANQFLLAIASACQQIATYMIIYRLADGRAWKRNTLETSSPTTVVLTNLSTFQETYRTMDTDAVGTMESLTPDDSVSEKGHRPMVRL